MTRKCALSVLLGCTGIRLHRLAEHCQLRQIPRALTLRIVSQSVYSRIHAIRDLSKNRSFLISLTLTLNLSSLSSGQVQIRDLFVSRNFNSLSTRALHITVSTLRDLQARKHGVKIVSRIRRVARHVPIHVYIGHTNGKHDFLRILWDSGVPYPHIGHRGETFTFACLQRWSWDQHSSTTTGTNELYKQPV